PALRRARVERAALRAVRSAQMAWDAESTKYSIVRLDRAMAVEMGMTYAAQAIIRRQSLALIGVSAVECAQASVLEIEHPFDGPGDALKVYDKAAEDVRRIR